MMRGQISRNGADLCVDDTIGAVYFRRGGFVRGPYGGGAFRRGGYDGGEDITEEVDFAEEHFAESKAVPDRHRERLRDPLAFVVH
jgi:hypothetical protein